MALFKMINLLDIQNDLITKDIDLMCVLRKCLILAFDLDSDELKNWAKMELNGYNDSENLPDYRKIDTHFEGEFVQYGKSMHDVNNIYHSVIEVDDKKTNRLFFLTFGVSHIQSLYDRHQPYPEEYIRNFTFNYSRSLYDNHFSGYRCTRLIQIIPTETLAYTLDSIKNRLLDFILELRKIYPELYVGKDEGIDGATIKNIFNTTIYGNANISNASDNFGQLINETENE